MLTVKDDGNVLRPEFFDQMFADLFGHTFLILQSARVHIDKSPELRKPDELLLRYIGNVGRPEERNR